MRNDNLPPCWQDVETVLDSGVNRLILFGPTGTGKTYAGLTMGDVGGGAHRLECTETMTDFDIVGGFLPGQNGFTYHDGAAIKAWDGDGLRGGRLVVDEIDKAGGDPYAVLLAMTDSPESASWQHPATGRIHKPKDGFSVIMTTNMEQPDDLPEALRSRFPVAIRIDRPHPDALRGLPREWRAYADRMADAGEKSIDIRQFQAIAKLQRGVGLAEAVRLVLGKDRVEAVVDAIRIDQVA